MPELAGGAMVAGAGAPANMQKFTTVQSLPLKARTQSFDGGYLSIYPSVKGADPPEWSDDDLGEPDAPEQANLPTGPTHVAARGTPKRTAVQLASARAFMAAAGHVKFDRGRATLKAVWMTFAYYASLGDGRVCFATLKTLADRALVTGRTVRRCVQALIDRGLIQTDNRKGGHAPTTWTVHAFSPSVLGGQDVRPGRTGCPARADRMSAEVSNRSTAPMERVLLASKQQPDGAPAPPAVAVKQPDATNEQPKTETPAPTHTDGQTGGGAPRGATDKQIKYLKVLADRVGADHAEDLWRAADPKRLQAQMNAAKPFKDLKEKHTHQPHDEAAFRVGVENCIGYKEVVQRCACGAVRSAIVDRGGGVAVPNPWVLSGYLVDYLVQFEELHGPLTDAEIAEHREKNETVEALAGRWTVPMTFSEVKHLYETLPDSPGWAGKLVRADWHTR